MKIDRQKLIDLLVEKTELDRNSVESQLDELIERIKRAAKKGKALEIKGFGVFYFSKKGELKFDPSEDLQTEVNHKYAGMEPVEIKKPGETALQTGKETGSEKEPEEKAEEEETEEDIFGISTSGSKEAPGMEKKERKLETEEENRMEADENVTSPFEEKPEETPEEELQTTAQADRFSEEPEKEQARERDIAPLKSAKNPVSTLITSIVAVLVIIIGVIIAVDLGYLDSFFGDRGEEDVTLAEPRTPAPSADPAPDLTDELETERDDETELPLNEEADPVTAEAEEAEAELPDEAVETDEADVEEEADDPVLTDEPEAPQFGLHGDPQNIEGNHYTIVLHSLESENRAEQLRQDLLNEGYRAVHYRITREDVGTMWRVGIGQFETIQSALDAAGELPDPYRENHFIGLIQ